MKARWQLIRVGSLLSCGPQGSSWGNSVFTPWVISLVLSTLVFWCRVFRWTQSSPILLYLLAQEFQGFALSTSPAQGCRPTQLCSSFYRAGRIKLRPLYFARCAHAHVHRHTNTQTLAPHTPLGRPVEEAKDSAMTQDWLTNGLLRSCLQPPMLELQVWVFFLYGWWGFELKTSW